MFSLATRRRFSIGGVILGAALALALNTQTSSSAETSATHRVVIENFKFVPATLTIRPGDSVEWINLDIVPHTATADNGMWDTNQLTKNASGTITYTSPGQAAYFCRYHPNMRGEIIIAEE